MSLMKFHTAENGFLDFFRHGGNKSGNIKRMIVEVIRVISKTRLKLRVAFIF